MRSLSSLLKPPTAIQFVCVINLACCFSLPGCKPRTLTHLVARSGQIPQSSNAKLIYLFNKIERRNFWHGILPGTWRLTSANYLARKMPGWQCWSEITARLPGLKARCLINPCSKLHWGWQGTGSTWNAGSSVQMRLYILQVGLCAAKLARLAPSPYKVYICHVQLCGPSTQCDNQLGVAVSGLRLWRSIWSWCDTTKSA